MLETVLSYLREQLDGQKKVELNLCLALLSKYFIEGGAGADLFPKLKREVDKFVSTNGKRHDIQNLEKYWNSYSDLVKCDYISKHFNIGRNNLVAIPATTRAKAVVIAQGNNRIAPLEELYDRLVASRSGINRTSLTYIWQWRITASEYEDICNTVEICKSFDKNEVKDLLNNEKCIFIIVAYTAERYKREWFGNDRQENALKQIGLGDKVEKITNAYFKDRSKDLIFRHPTGEHEYLWSLRVEGGLPIKYIVDGDNQLSHFSEKIFREYKKAIKFLLEQLNNKSIRYSYEAKHSIYEYLETLKTDDGPFCIYGTDAEYVDIFKRFTTILKNERAKAQRESNKFGLDYSVWRWKNSEEFTLHQNIIFRQSDSFKETNEIISIERLKQWGIEPTYIFWLRIGNRDYEFHPWKDNYYRSIHGNCSIPLEDVDLSKSTLPRASVAYIPQKGDGTKDLAHKEVISNAIATNKDYIIFSSNDGHRWSQNHSGNYSAVLIIKPAEIEGKFEELELEGGMRWVEFDGQITINKQVIYSSKNIILPKEEALHSIAQSSWVKNIRCEGNGLSEPIYLLSASNLKGRNFEKIDEEGNRLNIEGRLQYKDHESHRYKDLDQENLPQGLVSLRMDNIVIKGYIFPDTATISRDTANRIILIKGFESYTTEITEEKDLQVTTIGDTIKISDKYTENKLIEVIPISFKKDDVEISFEIVRPLKRKDRILRGRVLDINQSIPKKLASQYKIREFDETGVRNVKDKSCSQKYSNKKIQCERHKYIVDRGNNVSIESSLLFIFWDTSGNIYPLEIVSEDVYSQGKYITHLHLTGIPECKEGYIIQSLEKQNTEITYYEPFPVGIKAKNGLGIKSIFANGISAIERLKMCIKHGLYIDDFLTKKDISANLFKRYSDFCDEEGKDINYKILWEGALDLKYNWLLIPRKEWIVEISKGLEKEKVNELLLNFSTLSYGTYDILQKYIYAFWDFEWKGKITARSSDERKFVKYIMTGEGDSPSRMPDLSGILNEMNK